MNITRFINDKKITGTIPPFIIKNQTVLAILKSYLTPQEKQEMRVNL